jgi:hypothetical protein
LDGHERDVHVSQNSPSSLPDYGDARVSREEAVALWPHPLRARWSVSARLIPLSQVGQHVV